MYDLFINAYSITSLVMFPILLFIAILLIRDLGNYSKLSDKINKIIKDLSEDITDKGFRKKDKESSLSHISRFINKK